MARAAASKNEERGSVFNLRAASVLACGLGHVFSLPCFLTPLHFFRRNIFNVGGNAPMMAEWIDNFSIPVAPKHICDGHNRAGACVYRFFVYAIDILDIQKQARRWCTRVG